MWNIVRFIFLHPLTRTAKLRAFLRVLAWQIRCRLREEVVVPWVGGTRLAARRGMTGVTGNIYAGLHEFGDMMFLLHFLRPDDLFLDVGANVGSYTVLASGACKARTMAFEPDPDTVVLLERNIAVNDLGGAVTVRDAAVGDAHGIVRFTMGLGAVNQVAEPGDENVRLVPQLRLDDVMDGLHPVMMKIDVEGYEDQAMRGAEQLLANESLLAIEIETLSAEIEERLAGAGFERMYYDPYRRRLDAAPNGILALNALYVRDPDLVAARLAGADKVRIFDNLI